MGAKFRFQDLKIWPLAVELTDKLLDIARMDFSKFLSYAQISTFKNPNILIILNRRNLLQEERLDRS